jgi:hypothetical protein
VIVSAGPNWLGSPQHFVVGAIAAMVVFAAARSRWIRLPEWVAFVLAVSLVSTAELVLELIEYPLLYADHFHHSAYYDTLTDMASSIVDAIVGGVVAAIFTRRRVASPRSASGETA